MYVVNPIILLHFYHPGGALTCLSDKNNVSSSIGSSGQPTTVSLDPDPNIGECILSFGMLVADSPCTSNKTFW